MPAAKTHLLTISIEDYFQASAFNRLIEPDRWSRFEARVERNTLAALDLLDAHGTRATFFALGWIAERLPDLLAEVVRRGHEVASKGFHHRSPQEMTREAFREDLLRARAAIERATRVRVLGHRVAKGSLGPQDDWALDLLAAEGFRYDSSWYPLLRTSAGEPWRRFPFVHRHGERELWEMPISSWGPAAFSLPLGGNALRQVPRPVMERVIADWDRRYAHPLNLFFHVWELDADAPRISAVNGLTRLRQYRNLERMEETLRHYLARYAFQPIAAHLGLEAEPCAPPPPAPVPEPSPAAPPGHGAGAPLTIVIPCFNEVSALPYLRNTLDEIVAALPGYAPCFLFVDDCSTDETWALMHELFTERADCRFVRHAQNQGVAGALMTGIREARTELVASMDCDCSYDPLQLAEMLPLLEEGVDVVTASPYHPEGAVKNVPEWRLVLSRGLSRLYRLLLHHKLDTYTSCFRVYRRSAWVDLELSERGFLGVAEMLGRLDLQGGSIREFPAVLESRLLGYSKLSVLPTVAGHLRLLGRLGWSRLSAPSAPR